MKYINEEKISDLLEGSKYIRASRLDCILKKSMSLQRLTLEEAAVLLSIDDEEGTRKIFAAANFVKNAIYGKRIVLFAPLYISNFCANACLYCAFKSDNALTSRRALNTSEIKKQVECLLNKGHKRILLVAGEAGVSNKKAVDYYNESIEAVYSANVGKNRIRRANINCAPLTVEEFRKLKDAGIGTYQLFQETYKEKTYRHVHPKGPKSDPDNRIDAIERAFMAGIDDVGMGVLYGLYDWRFETLALLMHIEALEKKFNVGPHTISVPRLEPAKGVEFVKETPYKVNDNDFKKIVAVLRLAVPYTGIILSTREAPRMRDELFSLGVSQISADSRTSPGGYSPGNDSYDSDTQFDIQDYRSLDEIIGSLIMKGFIPSFCAACYRKERTGEAFMNLARPGTIKGKCSINALITLKEYLDDFASGAVKEKGYKLIKDVAYNLDKNDSEILSRFFNDIDKGMRDEYV